MLHNDLNWNSKSRLNLIWCYHFVIWNKEILDCERMIIYNYIKNYDNYINIMIIYKLYMNFMSLYGHICNYLYIYEKNDKKKEKKK